MIDWKKIDNKKITSIAKGLYKNPKSPEWRSEYSKLSRNEKDAVKYLLDTSDLGLGANENGREITKLLNEE